VQCGRNLPTFCRKIMNNFKSLVTFVPGHFSPVTFRLFLAF
jgi:hypothetical protein